VGSSGPKVQLLKNYLNKLLSPAPNLNEKDKKFDTATAAAVMRFKTAWGVVPQDATVDAKTWGTLGAVAGLMMWPHDLLQTIPAWFRNLMQGTLLIAGPIGFSRPAFFDAFTEHYGPLTGSQMAGLDALLGFIERDPAITDIRWAAYLLATVKWECADTWLPIEEYGKGAGHTYGNAVTIVKNGVTYTNAYYGRGYVQLTWKDNYQRAGEKLGVADDLVLHPEKVLDPETAYDVMSFGMVNGVIFANGHKLADYTHSKKMDYVGARHMVNGVDHNKDIAEIAEQLEVMLRASLTLFASSAAAGTSTTP